MQQKRFYLVLIIALLLLPLCRAETIAPAPLINSQEIIDGVNQHTDTEIEGGKAWMEQYKADFETDISNEAQKLAVLISFSIAGGFLMAMFIFVAFDYFILRKQERLFKEALEKFKLMKAKDDKLSEIGGILAKDAEKLESMIREVQ